ncbi:putative permease [Rivularia sp. PCC 7116]|uniref:sulfite exporter TauE/SafE family protein n=1 Tax=Rivularia sp. PCC 7116 TaxID=373994 RepID=UPI00029F2C50|nr:sulfite exporter TauE/SafE family protein [Rivularia sp. PCC 7116]AFY53713.1 putative permease [Rivularia sp. PCC 7116]
MESIIFLFTASLLAGIVNGVAGGGGLIAFPALLISGIPSINANATNATALWFGTVASTVAYRREFLSQRHLLLLLSSVSILGGIFGSYLLLHTSPAKFSALVPYLMLIATLLFIFSQPLMKFLNKRNQNSESIRLPLTVILPWQLAIATYGGYFGGGSGILMLALLNFTGLQNIHRINAYKSWLASCINAAAITHFAFADKIIWFEACIMAAGAIIGAYSSAYLARKLHPLWIRSFIIGVSLSMTCYFFIQQTNKI